MTADDPGGAPRALLAAYGRGDLDGVRDRLAGDLVAYVTTAAGGADRVEGRDAYLARLPDLRGSGGSLEVDQVLAVDGGLALAMVEIRAARGGDRLHNHAALLARVEGGLVARLWMVEAQPAQRRLLGGRGAGPFAQAVGGVAPRRCWSHSPTASPARR